MLKTVLLATSMMVAVPAFAQDVPAQGSTGTQQSAPSTTTDAPATADDASPGTQGAGTAEEAMTPDVPATTPPATEGTQPTPDAAAPAPAQSPTPSAASPTPPSGTSAAAAPAATQDQVAQAVTRDFAKYDTDKTGVLSQVEFGTWMSALRTAAEPGFAPGTADAAAWLNQAFASTDADKNKSVDKTELTTFLTPKAS